MDRQVKIHRNSRFLGLLSMLMIGVAVAGAEVDVTVAVGDSCIRADQAQKGYVRVALQGIAPATTGTAKMRAPVNVALVLDRSGSMQGEKLEKVKEAAILTLDRLDDNDIVSVVAYDDQVNVLVPATKLTDRERFRMLIRGLGAGNSTALHAGMLQGGVEVGKFLDAEHVNRIVLLSDGLANVGPQTPEELGSLGAAMAQKGISVTTIGVGLDFNEDLMTTLAARSDGNHLFAERAEDVAAAFGEETRDVTTVVAKNLGISLTLDPRVHPIRALGREASCQGQTVFAGLNQLSSGQTKYVLIEVWIDPLRPDEKLQAASVRVEYADLLSNSIQVKKAGASILPTLSPELAATGENADVMECVVAQVAVESNRSAVQLRDKGQVEKSREVLEDNARWLRDNAAKYNSKTLESLGKTNSEQASKVGDNAQWKGLRKSMSKGQFDVKQQTAK